MKRQHDISGYSWVVTENDIEQGLKSECRSCPHALAIQRTYGDYDAYVSATYAQTHSDVIYLRPETIKWIMAFDTVIKEPTLIKPGLHCSEP